MNFIKKDLAVGITVYRPEFKNLSGILNTVKKSIDNYTLLMNIDPAFENEYPATIDRWDKKSGRNDYKQMLTSIIDKNVDYLKEKGFTDNEEVLMYEELNKIYIECFTDYLKNNKNTKMLLPYIKNYNYNFNDKNWSNLDFSIHKHSFFDPDDHKDLWNNEKNSHIPNDNSGLSLGWHFDEFNFKNETHYRHAITSNIYLNDDYESGRIQFVYGPNCDDFKNFDNLKIISYKPMAGDVIFFPSFWPVGHSVTVPFKNDRYLISKIFKYLYKTNDFDEEFMQYCKDLYSRFHISGAIDVKSEQIQTINGKDFWADYEYK